MSPVHKSTRMRQAEGDQIAAAVLTLVESLATGATPDPIEVDVPAAPMAPAIRTCSWGGG